MGEQSPTPPRTLRDYPLSLRQTARAVFGGRSAAPPRPLADSKAASADPAVRDAADAGAAVPDGNTS